MAVEPEFGWAVAYEEPVDPPSPQYQWLEERERMRDREERAGAVSRNFKSAVAGAAGPQLADGGCDCAC